MKNTMLSSIFIIYANYKYNQAVADPSDPHINISRKKWPCFIPSYDWSAHAKCKVFCMTVILLEWTVSQASVDNYCSILNYTTSVIFHTDIKQVIIIIENHFKHYVKFVRAWKLGSQIIEVQNFRDSTKCWSISTIKGYEIHVHQNNDCTVISAKESDSSIV